MSNSPWVERRVDQTTMAGSWGDRRLDQSMKTGSWGVNDRGTRVTDQTIASVLVVDDDPAKRVALKAALTPLGLPIVEADSGQGALRILMEQDFAVILLDVRMPDMDGFETAALIRRRRESELTPIIFITAFAGDELGPKSKYVSGAVDFMFAPIHPDELRAKVSVFVNLYLQAAAFAERADEVQAAADHLTLLMDAAPIGIFQTDAEERFVYTNPRWTEISGVSRQDALGRDWDELMRSPSSPGVAFDDSHLTSRMSQSGQRFELTLPDATSKVVLSTSEPIHDQDGVLTGWVGTLADVTAETRAEQERSRFRSLVQNSRDVIVVLSEDGRCKYVSPAVLEVAGFRPEELVGLVGIDSVHPDDAHIVIDHLAEIAESSDSTKTIEVRRRTKSGGWIWIEMRAANRLDDPAIEGIVLNYHDITERRASVERLAQSEKLLADGQALSHLGSFTWDMRTNEVSWSDEQFRLYGFEPGSVLPTEASFLEKIHPDDVERVSAATAASKETGVPFEAEFRVIPSAGVVRWISEKGQVAFEEGVPGVMTGMSQDITSRREAEDERLRLLEQQKALADRLRMLLDSTGEGIYGVDADGVCTFMNASGATLLGGAADDFVGKSMHKLMHHTRADGSPYPASECPVVEGILKGEPTTTHSELVWRLDGSSFPADYSSYPIGGQGSAHGAVVAFQDVSLRLGMEAELRQSEQLFRGAFDAAQTGIALIAADGLTYVDVNRALWEMLGYTKAELLELNWQDITHPDDLLRNQNRFEKLLAGDLSVQNISKRYLRKDGEIIEVDVTDSVVRAPDGVPIYYVAHVNDVTERKRASDEKERLEGELVQAQKMEAVGQLAGGVAHDFNNILSVILNYAQFAAEGLDPADERFSDINEISKAGDKAARLVHQLLAFSRKELVQERVLDINAVLSGIHQILSRSLGEDVDLDFQVLEGLPRVMADQGRIEQVLLNLAVNARDSMPDGGVLKVSTTLASIAKGALPPLAAGDYVLVTVSDSGTGIEESTVERIFEPFFTTKPRGEGTGMGLSTAYGIIEQAGGCLKVASEVGVGTTFSIYLPATAALLIPEADQETKEIPSGSETILLVEDEDAVRDLVYRILLKYGYKVIPHSSGAEAMEYCVARSEPIDLLITDVVMPVMSGRELSDKATAIQPGLKTLFMSGYTDALIAQRGVLASGENLITKPFKPDQLLRTVRSLLDSKVATS